MHILIEGQSYLVKDLEKIFNDARFYSAVGDFAIVNSVGYYYSTIKKVVVYMLPKVFMAYQSEEETKTISWDKKNTIFKKPDNNGYLSVKDLYDLDKLEGSIKHESKYEWIRHITINFYNSLIEFRRRNRETIILNEGTNNDLNTNIGNEEYTYLDIFLSITNFYKKNKTVLLFNHIDQISNQSKRTKWEKTIRKTLPIIDRHKAPVYLNVRNRKATINIEEDLIIYFFSILNHFKEENNLNLSIDKSYTLLKGESFSKLQKNGLGIMKLKKIRYKYFSDTMRQMYKLCELYFDSLDKGSIKKTNEEYISFRNYNIVFEDMVDKLLTEPINLDSYNDRVQDSSLSIKKLKKNKDGKIIDHLYEYKSLIDSSNIFYIGDSKYYRPGNIADKLSIYKQFTYAKNIVQFNIDLFNERNIYASDKVKYRDEITEGYNITPNFLLYGFISDYTNFNDDLLEPLSSKINESVRTSYHFKTRMFDRDTLFIYQYKINYLFILNAYTEKSKSSLDDYRIKTKNKFRENFVNYFENVEESNFIVYKLVFSNSKAIKDYVESNFKLLNGRCFGLDETTLLIAIYDELKLIVGSNDWNEVTLLKKILKDQMAIDFSTNSKDIFHFDNGSIKEYALYNYKEGLHIAAEDIT